ncbi:thiamine phosphate synthase [Flaviflagellibacter deserti]|jgi:thiamine-phosphate pyrophosphorylase|uniref:Thiamine-phosphate synthase n=1 Tax=Flaviflagellibacter deserti TaxID=2267266 RepID=A0ABV9YYK1_9HYPH
MLFDLSLYLVAGRPACRSGDLLSTVEAAIRGGVTIVQLRDPAADGRALVEDARALLAVLRPRGIPLIINDRIDVAIAAAADGVHLGQDDIRAFEAREIGGPDMILGLSVGSPAEFAASREDLDAVDYLGVGPYRVTSTKANAGAAIGAEGIAAVRALTSLPIVGIGGIEAEHAAPVIRTGVQGVAVVSAICGASDPEAAARVLAAEIASAR